MVIITLATIHRHVRKIYPFFIQQELVTHEAQSTKLHGFFQSHSDEIFHVRSGSGDVAAATTIETFHPISIYRLHEGFE